MHEYFNNFFFWSRALIRVLHSLGYARFKVLTVIHFNIIVFWNITPCGFVDTYKSHGVISLELHMFTSLLCSQYPVTELSRVV